MDFEKVYNDVSNMEPTKDDIEIINQLNEKQYSSVGEAVTIAYMIGKHCRNLFLLSI